MRQGFWFVAVGVLTLVMAGTAHAGFDVPEPTSLTLLGAGVAGLAGAGWWFRRRK